jgi:hypothetical protein
VPGATIVVRNGFEREELLLESRRGAGARRIQLEEQAALQARRGLEKRRTLDDVGDVHGPGAGGAKEHERDQGPEHRADASHGAPTVPDG